MDNPVEIVERVCPDNTYTNCGAPKQFEIRRQITIAPSSVKSKGASDE
jgi:hypothetical protein